MSDNKVDMELILENDLMFELMLEAHKRDITLNQFIELVLTHALNERKLDELQRQSNPIDP
jgi:hypothetical protein